MPISSCSFRTCFTAKLILYALQIAVSENKNAAAEEAALDEAALDEDDE